MKRHQDSPGVVALPPLIYGVPLASGLLLNLLFPLPLDPVWTVPGVVLATLGLALAAWGNRVMVKAGTNVNPLRPSTALVTDGPFRYSRNPLYVSLTLIYAGVALALNAGWALLALPAVLWVVHRGVILREEAYLARKFGAAYGDYARRVRRWL